MKTFVFAGKCIALAVAGLLGIWLFTWHRDHPVGAAVTSDRIEQHEIEAWMKKNMADPEASLVEDLGLQIIGNETTTVVRVRARNALGGWVIEKMVFRRDAENKVQGLTVLEYAHQLVAQRERVEDGGLIDAQVKMLVDPAP